jgi:hypothetical protein
MTHHNVVAAPPSSDAFGIAEPEILDLDPDVATLFAEVDAILCEALLPHRRSPAPPAIGRALAGPRSAGRSYGVLLRPRHAPARPARATERGPPSSTPPPRPSSTSMQERQVIASHRHERAARGPRWN